MATQPYSNLQYAQYVDVNPQLTINTVIPELIPDIDSVKWSSFFNLFKCPVGARGRIFQPTFGSNLWWLLQEPLDEVSREQLQKELFGAIKRWEPRVTVDESNSGILVDYTLPGYHCALALVSNIDGTRSNVSFNLKVSGW